MLERQREGIAKAQREADIKVVRQQLGGGQMSSSG